MSRFDVTTFGEGQLRFSVPAGHRLERANQLDVHAVCTCANVTGLLARLGWSCGWISSLPTTPLGQRVANEFRLAGLDLSAVVWTDKYRLATYYVEYAVPPRSTQVYYDRSNWLGRKDLEGGPLYTQCSHFIDLLIYMFGDIQRVNSIGETKCHNIEVEDCGVAMLKFKSGVMGTLSYTNCVYNKNYEGSITIVGENGTIRIGGSYLNTIDFWDIQSYPLPLDVSFDDKPNVYAKYKGTASNHDKVIANVVADILDGTKRVAGWEDGHKVVEAIRMIYSSQERNGGRITVRQMAPPVSALPPEEEPVA